MCLRHESRVPGRLKQLRENQRNNPALASRQNDITAPSYEQNSNKVTSKQVTTISMTVHDPSPECRWICSTYSGLSRRPCAMFSTNSPKHKLGLSYVLMCFCMCFSNMFLIGSVMSAPYVSILDSSCTVRGKQCCW